MEGYWSAVMVDFVIDASVLCAWALPDENSATAETAIINLRGSNVIAPDLIWHEVRNVPMVARRRNRIDFNLAMESFQKLRNLGVATLPISNESMILALAERHKLTAYDAAYLTLALETKLPLATLDKQLIAAATHENVPLLA